MRRVELPDQKIGYFHHIDSHDCFVIELEDGSICSFDQNYIKFIDPPEEVYKPDWNQIKIQASIAAMQGLCAAHTEDGTWSHDAITAATTAVEYADALVEKLKKQTK